jgi:MoxR-like ATPase/biotin carboxyl carrier protein
MKTKIQKLLDRLNQGLVEREHVLKTVLLAVLAGENPVLIGPPGTGKSLIARRVAQSLAGGANGENDYFEYLLTKFSTPEEIFGPLSIRELKADRFSRNTQAYLPSVHMAFLDEIFKASSSILNALLTILNERLYHNGAERQAVPLIALIAASNELPADQEELGALYDRFLVRVFVDYVSEASLPQLFEDTDEPELSPSERLTHDDLAALRQAAAVVTLPPSIAKLIQQIWVEHREMFKEDRRESLSDRRLKKLIGLLRVSAATNGRREVDFSDVFLLKDSLWSHPDNMQKVKDLVLKSLQDQLPTAGKLEVHSELVAIRVPHLSENVSEAMLMNWHKKEGDIVNCHENLIDIETDKVVLEAPAPTKGMLVEIIKSNGDTVTSGEVIGYIGTEMVASADDVAPTKVSPTDYSHTIEVKVPDIGNFSNVRVIELFVKVRDTIKVDDAIATLESDKATMDVASSAAGVIKEVLVNLGDHVSEGAVLIKVQTHNAARPATKATDLLAEQIRANIWL